MEDDNEQIPAAGDGPTQEDNKANKEAAAVDGFIDEKTKYEILQRCYGLVTREVMRPRSCFRLPFSFKLPSPYLVVKKIIRDQKFGRFLKEYSKDIKNYEDYNMEEKGCCKQCCLPRAPRQTSQGSGAPPSADNV